MLSALFVVTACTPLLATRTIRERDATLDRAVATAPVGARHRAERGGETAIASNDKVVPATEFTAAHLRIRELERDLDRKTMEVETLQAARDEVKEKKTELLRRVKAMIVDRYKMAPIWRMLGIRRSSVYRESTPRPERYARADDRTVTAQIRAVIRARVSYGARRVTALVNREFDVRYNNKRIRRVMDINGWKLPRSTRRRTGRAHTGVIRRDSSNERSAVNPALQGSRAGAATDSKSRAGMARSYRSDSPWIVTTGK